MHQARRMDMKNGARACATATGEQCSKDFYSNMGKMLQAPTNGWIHTHMGVYFLQT
jgi:hypothetical protein